ncbi:hypothetical protein D3C84_1237750 [compost metagenome]
MVKDKLLEGSFVSETLRNVLATAVLVDLNFTEIEPCVSDETTVRSAVLSMKSDVPLNVLLIA